MKLPIFFFIGSLVFGCAKASDQPKNIDFVIKTEAQTETSPTPPTINPKLIDFNVGGVRLGDTEALVLQKLGRPVRRNISDVDNCGISRILELQYDGMEVQLDRGLNNKWYVLEILVTGPNISINPGINIGEDLEIIEDKLGKAYVEQQESETSDLSFLTRDNDNAYLSFRQNKLVRVRMFINPC